jgi:opacity protein-like surface antigen
MKRTLLTTALLGTLTISCQAGVDSAPMSQHDGKDMKDMKQMTQTSESDAGFYVAALGGAQFDTQYGDNRQTLTAAGTTAGTNADLHSHWGGVGGIKAGYNFQSFPVNFMNLRLQPAVEAEGLYIGSDDVHSTNTFAPGMNSHISTNSGDFFVNGILRFKNNSRVTPYVGVGAGLQYITTHGTLDGGPAGTAPSTGLDTSDLDFAGQALFGLDVAVCNHISLFTEYKFIDAIGTDGKSTNAAGGATYRFKPDEIQQNLITAGVKYTF